MLAAYVPNGHSLARRDIVSGEEMPDNAVFISYAREDLAVVQPAREEHRAIGAHQLVARQTGGVLALRAGLSGHAKTA
jgi:hypothetical protein